MLQRRNGISYPLFYSEAQGFSIQSYPAVDLCDDIKPYEGLLGFAPFVVRERIASVARTSMMHGAFQ